MSKTRLIKGCQAGALFNTAKFHVCNDGPDDGGSMYLWNVGKLTPEYTAQQPGRQPSSQNFLVQEYSKTYCFTKILALINS
jgi:hypothetical protein